jgi:hypothetical protein
MFRVFGGLIMSHHENSGLQRHSVGAYYPYAIRVVENQGAGRGVVVCYHAITGAEVSRHNYAIGTAGWDIANANAEADAINAAGRDRETSAIVAARIAAELCPAPLLQLCTVYLPAVPAEYGAELYPRFRNWLAETYGGYTVGGEVRGFWRDPADGAEFSDRLTPVSVGVEVPADFIAALAGWVPQFFQRCLFVVGPAGVCTLVYPAEVPASAAAEDSRNQRAYWYGEAD